MNRYQSQVAAFMSAMGQDTPERPTLEQFPFKLRCDLILEEAQEFVDACGLRCELHTSEQGVVRAGLIDENTGPLLCWPDVIDALCDLLYVTYGAAVAMGIDLDPFFEAVHAANMAKTTGPVRADGKRLKPEGWKPPDIENILARILAGDTPGKDGSGA